jgi:hypothetical protein
MPYARKIVLKSQPGGEGRLDALVAALMKDGVAFVGVVGPDCARVEDLIDEIVVGDGSQDYNLLTSSHPGESLEQAIAFAKSLRLELAGTDVQVLEL